MTDYCNSETRKTEQWQADAFHRKEDCRLFAHAAAGHSCCIPGRQLLNGQPECMKKPGAKPSFSIPFIIRPAHGSIPAALSSGQRSYSGAKMSVSQSAMQNMQRQPYYTGRYTASAARTNYISPKFFKRCFCLRPACGRQVQGIKRAAVYVILQAFDNAADQVKAALPQGGEC